MIQGKGSTDQEVIYEYEEKSEEVGSSYSINRQRVSDENISNSSLKPKEAFQYFQETTSKKSPKEFEYFQSSDSRRKVESPWERFLRIQGELESLRTDLVTMEVESSSDNVSMWAILQDKTKELLEETESLRERHSHHLNPSVSTTVASSLQETEQVFNSLLKELSTKTAIASDKTKSLKAEEESEKNVAFRVFVAKEVLRLEQRVFALESALGLDSQSLSTTAKPNQMMSLPSQLGQLEEKLSCLENADVLKTRIVQYKSELESVLQRFSAKIGTISSIGELSELVNRLEQGMVGLGQAESVLGFDLTPLLVRLKSLELLHTRTAGFSRRLDEAETTLTNLTQEVQSNTTLLTELKDALNSNLATLGQNLLAVEGKLGQAADQL